MNRFAALLDRLAYEPRRLGKLALLEDYFRTTPDPDRGWALAAMTGALSFKHAKPGLVRQLAAERTDPVLFGLSWDFVGDLAETVALMWPANETRANAELSLSDVVEGLATTAKEELPARVAEWLDRLDENGRWALLKLITGALRIGVSARLARTALARLGGREPDEIEDVWHADAPPYAHLFAWLEGRGEAPSVATTVRFYPPMLSHAIEPEEFAALDPADFCAEWKWDGIRVQAAAGKDAGGRHAARLFSRTGDDVSASFPDLVSGFEFEAVLDGELLIKRGGGVQDFNTLQQRLNRKSVTAKLMAEYPAFIRVYDLLALGDADLRALPFAERRAKLEDFVAANPLAPIDLSPMIPFKTWEELTYARANPADSGAGIDAEAVEGVMIKRRDSPYLAGRPKGYWFKWKRDPMVIDAVLMYAQRGSGKRSSFYSDYTFGVWTAAGELTPVGKAYFGFTDEELMELDRFVRNNTENRFGPVREVTHTKAQGLVLEVAFEGLQRSTRHKSGVAMRFPRISRIRWDKRPSDADTLEDLEKFLRGGEPAQR
ncbi:MAG TPA: cisplatin damage response ATP-dependent DNA ligase [Vitreimonas sp.]|uniref:cisplatin damage response ATP-dependent DNA ligase n=1 Tax=Vitreimonas sp. TaxID=3069702 RepID=UPI002D6916B4|nr:cisplatin damage response ATP-dependent DNA ligase [Vitreimonas sp.]HYD89068.1 cisplatin damage response ATP-dependent DNA ligase [Vitreimonas sp.]